MSDREDIAVIRDVESYDHPTYSKFVLGILLVCYTLSFVDRQFLSVVAQPVKESLGLSDTQLGLLGGLTFAIFYTVFGIPVAMFADRTNRVRIVACACAMWSLCTAACGMSTGFLTLALARVGVGVGEAGGSAPSHSIISDYFPRHRRASALAIFSLGNPMGLMLGAAFGGWVAAHYGWRSAFFVLGAIGLLVAPLMFFAVREPSRGRYDTADLSGGHPSPLVVLKSFFSRPNLIMTALSAGLSAFVGYAVQSWAPAFLIREKGLSMQDISIYYSLTLGVGLGIGTFFGGYVVDRMTRRNPAAYAIVPGVAMLFCIPLLVGFVYATSWHIALLMLAGLCIFGSVYFAPSVAFVQNSVAANERAVASSILLFSLNLIGLGAGPLFVGAISDHLEARGVPNALGLGILGLTVFCALAFFSQMVTAWFIVRNSQIDR